MSQLTQPMSEKAFDRNPLPKRFCNLERVLYALQVRNLDGVVVTIPQNVFYLTGFNAIAHKSDEPRVCAVVLSRHAPEHPIMVVADYYLASFLTQETWVEDIRPFRAVMMALDLPAQRSDIDRFIPAHAFGNPWIETARAFYTFEMNSGLEGALKELKLKTANVAFDDLGFGMRLGVEGMTVFGWLRSDDVCQVYQNADGARTSAPVLEVERSGNPQDGCKLAGGDYVAGSQPRLRDGCRRTRRLRP